MFERIEQSVKKHLNSINHPTGTVLVTLTHDILHSSSVLEMWNILVPEENAWKIVLLREIATLWSTICVHAFARLYSEKIIKQDKKGTRKTLKTNGTIKQTVL